MSDVLTVHFSLRSPYSWLALHRLTKLGPRLGVPLSLVPLFPKPGQDGVPDPATSHARFRYTVEDAARIAAAYGLAMRPPASLDTRWELPHAACAFADAAGRGLAFAVAAGAARFTRARDLGDPEVIAEIATLVDLDPDATVAAARDAVWQAKVEAGQVRARQQGVFGVPFFLFRDQRFFGNDRLEWLLREIDRAAGRSPSDLAGEGCLQPVWTPRPG